MSGFTLNSILYVGLFFKGGRFGNKFRKAQIRKLADLPNLFDLRTFRKCGNLRNCKGPNCWKDMFHPSYPMMKICGFKLIQLKHIEICRFGIRGVTMHTKIQICGLEHLRMFDSGMSPRIYWFAIRDKKSLHVHFFSFYEIPYTRHSVLVKRHIGTWTIPRRRAWVLTLW